MPPDSEVHFSADLYLLSAVRESAAAFAELASVSVEANPGDQVIVVRFADVRPDVADALADEFCNHALAGTIEHRRVDLN